MALPHILLIPGFWEGTSIFDVVITSLRAHGYNAQAVPLLSTGHASPNNPSMKDDVACIRSVIAPLVEREEKDVILVLHSAGAFLGSMALKDLSAKERTEKGKKGGVKKIVFLAGAIWPEGFQHGPLPFFDYKGDEMYCIDAAGLLFNDLAPDTALTWISKLRCQPSSGWDDVVDYVGWKDIPSVYLLCEQDALLSPEMQTQMADRANSEIEKCDAGHCCMIGQPQRVLEVVEKAAGQVA
ncbi:MAG: hypothetical protein LQ339_006616 [Xanthoria mediterranea]|nr:MAG: hypothetical protein LQ339_006616 [Xanthoria mediterranea]